MKKLLLGFLLLFTTLIFSQEKDIDSTNVKWSKYIALGLSVSNGNDYGDNTNKYTFHESTYPSVEFGFIRENLSLSGVIGRKNFKSLGNHVDGIKNYYWEVKVTPTFPLGVVTANVIFGVGTYLNNQVGNGFIEYGSGITYTVGKFTYGVSYTNWDGLDYITPNVSYKL